MAEPPADESNKPRTNYRQLFSLAMLCAAIIWLIEFPIEPIFAADNRNMLLIGRRALLNGAYDVPLVQPLEFDRLTKPQLIQLRAEAVWQHPLLIAAGYVPATAVFSQIRDRAPWSGTLGKFYHGHGPHCIDGPADNSRTILNPYLLITVEFDGLSIQNENFLWDKSRIAPHAIHSPEFPLYCRPRSLTWRSRQSRAKVVYSPSDYVQRVNPYLVHKMSITDTTFSLTAINARDMNLNYSCVLPHEMRNVVRATQIEQPVEISDFLHWRNNCGHPDGCNGGLSLKDRAERFTIQALPARINVKLWQDRPETISQPADLNFTIRFE